MRKVKDRVIAEPHHRRPRSIGGKDNSANKSYVLKRDHQNWHVLFGNMNAFQICELVNKMEYKPQDVEVICKFINGTEVVKKGENNSKDKFKIKKAWTGLFDGLDFKGSLEYINNVWLDPSYHLYVKKEKKMTKKLN